METGVFFRRLAYMVSSVDTGHFRISGTIRRINPLLILLLTLILNFPVRTQTLYWQEKLPYYSTDIVYDRVENIYFIQPEIIGQYLWRSSNRGRSWTKFQTWNLRNLVCDNKRVVWAISDNYPAISTNGGNTWRPVTYPADRIYALAADKNGTIWASGSGCRVLNTSDTGRTWKVSILPTTVSNFGFTNDGKIFASDFDGNVYRSVNQGADWSVVYSNFYRVYEIVIDDSNHIYASKNKAVIISTDDGNSWQEFPGPSLGPTFSMNNKHVFYCKGYRSMDNCRTWSYVGPVQGMDQYCFVDSLIFVSGPWGVYLYDPGYKPYMGSNFFPLSIGNKWQYNITENGSSTNVITYYVDRDSVISDKRYFHLGGEVNEWVRYENDENILYLRLNDSDYVVMNFNLNEGSELSRIHFGQHHVLPAHISAPKVINLFGSDNFTRGSSWHLFSTPNTHNYHDIYYSEGLGIVENSEYWSMPGIFTSGIYKNIIRAVIHDSSGVNNYSDGVKPVISFRNSPGTGTFNIFWNFGVKHDYNNFIDSVYMVSYYSNNSSVVPNDTIFGFKDTIGTNFNIAFRLDSILMTSGYVLRYKFVAVDKGVVREYSTLPETGYGQLIYDPNLVSVEGNEINLTEYVLMQNFPNPFNPVTIIRYSVPRASEVSIKIYDVLGKEIALLLYDYKPAGMYDITWNAEGMPSGVYYCQLRSGSFVQTKKLMLLK